MLQFNFSLSLSLFLSLDENFHVIRLKNSSSNSLTEKRHAEFPFGAAGAERKLGPCEGAVLLGWSGN